MGQRGLGRTALILAALLVLPGPLVAACAASGGISVEVNALDGVLPDGIPGSPEWIEGAIMQAANGCTSVEVDGVTRYALWPRGSSVRQVGNDPIRYEIRVADGPVLHADLRQGDTFRAQAYIDERADLFGSDPERIGVTTPHVSKAQPLAADMAFCGLNGVGLIAIVDGSTVERVEG